MDEMLMKLLSAEVLSEDTKQALGEAVKTLIVEAEQKAEAKVRGELAARYEAERKTMVVAVEKFLDQGLKKEIKEFREGLSQVDQLKAKYASAIGTLREQAKKVVVDRLAVMESKLDEILRKEISELHADMKVNRKSYLNAIAESAAKAETDRVQFRKKAAKVLENIIDVKLTKEISDLREDIKAAKRTHFEGQIYEAFMTTFRRQFFDTNKEFKNLSAKLTEAEKKLAHVKQTANAKISEANSKISAISKDRAKLKESIERTQVMNKLLSTLTGTAKTKMRALLEATSTSELNRTYKKFVNEVLTEDTAPKTSRRIDQAVVELNTGSTKRVINESDDDIAEIIDMRRRAGLPAMK